MKSPLKSIASMTGNMLNKALPDEDEDYIEYCSTCRPCCTTPHGPISVTTAVFATVALMCSLFALKSCEWMDASWTYCEVAKPLYGECDDCHCIVTQTTETGGPVVTGAAAAAGECPMPPRDDYFLETIYQWEDLVHENPMTIDCNPYASRKCLTNPPQEVFPTSCDYTLSTIGDEECPVCGIRYNTSNLDKDQCPLSYKTVSFPSLKSLENTDGVYLTHYGSCGVCSSLQDLSVYVAQPDLTSLGSQCGILAMLDEARGVECFMHAGYSEPCAKMWLYNTINTREHCFGTCISYSLSGASANGPAPNCKLSECLECDEVESGDVFKQVAARTRRRSGLLSDIARPCDAVLDVDHPDPCPARSGTTIIRARQPDEVKCTDIKQAMGPLYYEGKKSNSFLGIDFLTMLNPLKKLQMSYYTTCNPLRLKLSVEGYWAGAQEAFGDAWRASAIFVVLAVLLGGIATLLTWTTTCVAYRQNFWTAMSWTFGLTGVFQLCALCLFASEVSEKGTAQFGGYLNFVAGVFWMITSVLACFARGPAKPDRIIACCCCPDHTKNTLLKVERVPREKRTSFIYRLTNFGSTLAPQNIYQRRDSSRSLINCAPTTTQVKITETLLSDGSVMTEKVTISPNGDKMVEVTTFKRNNGSSLQPLLEGPTADEDDSGSMLPFVDCETHQEIAYAPQKQKENSKGD